LYLSADIKREGFFYEKEEVYLAFENISIAFGGDDGCGNRVCGMPDDDRPHPDARSHASPCVLWKNPKTLS
jgi:hypothetical protein